MKTADFQILDVIDMKRKNKYIQTKCKDCYVLSCRIYGESTFFYNGETHIVHRGDVLYIPHGASYCQSCASEETIAIHLNISGNAAEQIRIFSPGDPEEMCRLFQSIFQFWQQPDGSYHCMSDLYKIVAISGIVDAAQADNTFGIISPSVRYLQAHLYDTDLSLAAFYRQSQISPTSLIKHFRKYFNCTPIQYVNRQRIQKALGLLCSGLYTREEIAFLCGFENVKHFYVVFKKLTGCTTGQYLKTHK